MKICNNCKVEKKDSGFYTSRGYLFSFCIECTLKQRRESYVKRPPRVAKKIVRCRCGETDISKFSKNRCSATGYQTMCKICASRWNIEKKYPSRYKTREDKRRAKVLGLYETLKEKGEQLSRKELEAFSEAGTLKELKTILGWKQLPW